MRIIVCATLALFCVTMARGEPCRLNTPVKSSALKCGDQIYKMMEKGIGAYNDCAQGKNGALLTDAHVFCYFEKMGMITNGVKDDKAVVEVLKQIFPKHFEEILKGFGSCFAAKLDASGSKNADCFLKAYLDVCKHETCDFINTLD